MDAVLIFKHKKVALVAYIPGTKELVNLVRSYKILEEPWQEFRRGILLDVLEGVLEAIL